MLDDTTKNRAHLLPLMRTRTHASAFEGMTWLFVAENHSIHTEPPFKNPSTAQEPQHGRGPSTAAAALLCVHRVHAPMGVQDTWATAQTLMRQAETARAYTRTVQAALRPRTILTKSNP